MDLRQRHTSEVFYFRPVVVCDGRLHSLFCFFSCGLVCMEKEGVLILFQEIVIYTRQSKLFSGTTNKHFAKL